MADKYEPDNTWQNANIIWINGQRPGQQYEWYQCHNFYHSGNVDWVKFYAVKGEWYTIDVKDVGANADPVIGIYDKDGQTLLKEVNCLRSGEPERGTFICPANGVCYARISQCEKEGCNIAYGEETEYTLILSVPVGPGEVMIYGYVRPVGGVKDCEIGTEEESLTFINGFYSSPHPTGTFTLTAKADHYKPYEKTILIEDVNKQIDITLELKDDADQDKDGMLDLWEEQYGLNLSVNDAAEDPDGDGLTHYKEYMLGSDPANPTGYLADDDLWIRAVIYTEEKGPIEAVWKKGGEDKTAGDHRVIWGCFHASPSDVDWGNPNNPDLFLKIWFDAGGRTDVNFFFHVSVQYRSAYFLLMDLIS